jgi:hypothetical protein
MSKRLAVTIATLVSLVAPGAAVAASTDRDHDGLPDRWERRHDLSTAKPSAKGDPDRDRLSNLREHRLRTDPRRADTDRDGLGDGAEVTRYKTDPRRADSDRDGARDGAEVRAGTNPRSEGEPPQAVASDLPDPLGPLPQRPLPTPTPRPTPSPTPTPTPAPTPSGCDRNATPSSFASAVSAASAGQTICLAAGSYGTWQGTNKRITVRAAAGATPTMRYSFGSGDAAFTLDGLNGMGGSITAGARDITIRNSNFNTHATFDGLANSNILFDHNTHNNINSPSGAPNARLGFYWGSSTPSGVTIQNSSMSGGDSDGVHTGVAVNVLGNTFTNICDRGGNHTDNIQFEGSVGGRIAGNYISGTCTTQGITSYDGDTNGVTIEDNVIDVRRAWGIEFYADKNSIIRHNTVRYYAPGCYGGSACGYIALDRKPEDPAGSGTQVYDNIGMIAIGNGSTAARNDHNQNGTTVAYQGPTDRWSGFELTAGSAGRSGASDGLDIGARIG